MCPECTYTSVLGAQLNIGDLRATWRCRGVTTAAVPHVLAWLADSPALDDKPSEIAPNNDI